PHPLLLPSTLLTRDLRLLPLPRSAIPRLQLLILSSAILSVARNTRSRKWSSSLLVAKAWLIAAPIFWLARLWRQSLRSELNRRMELLCRRRSLPTLLLFSSSGLAAT